MQKKIKKQGQKPVDQKNSADFSDRADQADIILPSSRILFVDTAKAIGIIAVFYGHLVEKIFLTYLAPAAAIQYKLIYSFHMPLFFVLAGYVIKKNQEGNFLDFLKTKFMTRVVPFLFFNLLILPCYVIDAKIQTGSYEIGGLLHRSLYLLSGRPTFNYITWFLACLFVAEMINYFLYPFLRKSKPFMCAAAALFYTAGWAFSYKADILQKYVTISDYWFFQEAFTAYSFYLLGNLLSSLPFFEKKEKGYPDIVLFLIMAAFVIFTFNLNNGPFKTYPVVVFAFGGYGGFLLFPLTALAGSVCVIALSRLIPSFRVMSFLGRNTLPLMGLNGILALFANGFLIKYSTKISSINHASVFAVCVFLTSVTLLLCVPFVMMMKKYVPFLVGAWKGRSMPL